jgi:hypothetical protein
VLCIVIQPTEGGESVETTSAVLSAEEITTVWSPFTMISTIKAA